MGISESCKHEMDCEVMPHFEFDQLGVPITILNSALKHTCGCCGQQTFDVQFPERLVAAAAVFRCKMPDRLLGQEIKFLRKSLEWTAAKLAERLNVAPETVSRWENDKAPMAPVSEQLFRVQVFSALKAKAPAIDMEVDEIVNMKIKAIRAPEISRMTFALVLFKEVQKQPSEEYSEPRRKVA